ncbi:hypothetical protein QBZ16_000126 [Prototheca wickerhamii]|uniref:Uncharacterized protein n=1 Tax=Prototheca wickerhamii TaxID=3111 RepID=A0AAD9IL02_PROWI|nr:hypothetical protein QBZ16_000126 [Prototheca wickerhamii]
MGAVFSRIGTDPYYASYEKSLSRIQSDVVKLKARLHSRRVLASRIRTRFLGGVAALWAVLLAYAAHVARAPAGSYTAREHFRGVLPAVLCPPTAWLLYQLLSALLAWLDRHTARRLEALAGKQRKMLRELKESTHYDRTLQLLKTYDPDDPVALRLLQDAQREAEQLRAAVVASETETLRLQAENRELRARLGLEDAAEDGAPLALPAPDDLPASETDAAPALPWHEPSSTEDEPASEEPKAKGKPRRKRLV